MDSYVASMLFILPFLFFAINAWQNGFVNLIAVNASLCQENPNCEISDIQYTTDGTYGMLVNSAFNFSKYGIYGNWAGCSYIVDKGSNMLYVVWYTTHSYLASYSMVSKSYTEIQFKDVVLDSCALSQSSILLCVLRDVPGSEKASMYFVDTQNGELKLAAHLPSPFYFFFPSYIVTLNGVYYATDGSFLYSFNLVTGQLLSIVKLQENFLRGGTTWSPLGIQNGTMKLIAIYWANEGSGVYLVDTITGSFTLLNRNDFGVSWFGPSVVDLKNNVFYTSGLMADGSSTKTYVISMADGKVLSELLLRDSIFIFYQQQL